MVRQLPRAVGGPQWAAPSVRRQIGGRRQPRSACPDSQAAVTTALRRHHLRPPLPRTRHHHPPVVRLCGAAFRSFRRPTRPRFCRRPRRRVGDAMHPTNRRLRSYSSLTARWLVHNTLLMRKENRLGRC